MRLDRLFKLLQALGRRGDFYGEVRIPFKGPSLGQITVTQAFKDDTVPVDIRYIPSEPPAEDRVREP